MGSDRAPEGLLKGKVTIITGASTGIGRALSGYFASAGASVVLAARSVSAIGDLADEINSNGGVALAVPTDVVDESSVEKLVATTVEEFGRLDAAVNNAGMNPSTFSTIDQYDMQEFRDICEVKIFGVANCVKHEVIAMKKEGRGGAIVNHSSIVGVVGQSGIYPAASTSQAALIGLTKSAATGCAGDRIRVNALAIGGVDTGTIASLPEAERQQIESRVPLGRLGRGLDIAAAAAFLCSDLAGWITGTVLPVDGGALA